MRESHPNFSVIPGDFIETVLSDTKPKIIDIVCQGYLLHHHQKGLGGFLAPPLKVVANRRRAEKLGGTEKPLLALPNQHQRHRRGTEELEET